MALRDEKRFKELMGCMERMTESEVDEENRNRNCGFDNGKHEGKANEDYIRDPTKVSTKGAPKTKTNGCRRQNRCGVCKAFGHNSRKCMKKGGNRQLGGTTRQQDTRYTFEQVAAAGALENEGSCGGDIGSSKLSGGTFDLSL